VAKLEQPHLPRLDPDFPAIERKRGHGLSKYGWPISRVLPVCEGRHFIWKEANLWHFQLW
jgi:hypothetical protein